MKNFLTDYGMVLVLIALCVFFSALTLKEQTIDSPSAQAELVDSISKAYQKSDLILLVGATNQASGKLAAGAGDALKERGFVGVRVVVGSPVDFRKALDRLNAEGLKPAAVVAGGVVTKWRVMENLNDNYPDFAGTKRVLLKTRTWPDFLKRSNLLAVVDRIVVIAVIAIGMTMVIITAGIDLSVGSLIALSAVIGTLVMKNLGGLDAPWWSVPVGFAAGTAFCGLIGGLGGWIVARFKVAPFITTLAFMLMARGMAFMVTGGFSIYQVPKALVWLGQGRTLGIPNTVIVLILLYVGAHLFMTRTRMGRFIYAIGGNEEAARLSGVPVKFVIIFVYAISGLAAGFGGCIQASQINQGTPSMCMMYELYVIAAVVVGGTSLAGGSGRILGTLIGAFIIAVIQNGMNLVGVESYTQQVVLGGVILAAVLLDKIRSSGGLASLLRKT
jgi:ribose transport system permease protein